MLTLFYHTCKNYSYPTANPPYFSSARCSLRLPTSGQAICTQAPWRRLRFQVHKARGGPRHTGRTRLSGRFTFPHPNSASTSRRGCRPLCLLRRRCVVCYKRATFFGDRVESCGLKGEKRGKGTFHYCQVLPFYVWFEILSL